MNHDEARKIAVAHITMLGQKWGVDLALLEGRTIERAFGWVFFYDSTRHIASGSIRDKVAGNAPIIVTRSDGVVHETGTAHPIEYYIDEFERTRS